jgi:hypothetical protein
LRHLRQLAAVIRGIMWGIKEGCAKDLQVKTARNSTNVGEVYLVLL